MTNAEFAALDRNEVGDIIDLYDVFFRLTSKQVNRLTGDDESRLDDYNEELAYIIHSEHSEFA
jgi:hypothetical protein|tara:strand:+ start:436 stop:624 length:189 start_codon:yes stop_codon:yes gene_type:complete